MSDATNLYAADDAASLPGTAEERVAALEGRLRDAERALIRSNGKLRQALELGKLGAWERDLATDEILADAACKAQFGLSPQDAFNFAQLQDLTHPDDLERLGQAISYALKTKSEFNVEFCVVRPNGSVARLLLRGSPIYDGDDPVRLIGVSQDITEREQARDERKRLQRRQEFLLRLNDQIRDCKNPSDIMDATTRNLARLMNVDSVGYGEFNPDLNAVVVPREWSRGILGNEGKVFPFEAIPKYQQDLMRRGSPIVIDDVSTDPNYSDRQSQEFYRSANVRSALAACVLREGTIAAVLYLTSAEPRQWSSDDVSLAEDVAKRTWTAIEKVRAETGLRDTQAHFRLLTEGLPGFAFICTPEAELVYVNRRWIEFSGLSMDASLRDGWLAAIHPDDVLAVRERLKISSACPLDKQKLRYRAADGSYKWFWSQFDAYTDAADGRTWMIGTSVDIGDLVEAEEALRKSEKRLSLAQRAAHIGVFDMDAKTGAVTWTGGQELLFGLEPGAFNGTYEGWVSRVHPADVAVIEKRYTEAVAARQREMPFSYRIPLADGTTRHIEGTYIIFYGEDGDPARIVGVNIDMTRHRQAEERQQLLIRELHHRVKNTLATVQAIVGSTARTATSIDEFYQGFVGRIVSLARTHNLLTEDLWQKASLRQLILTELGPYGDEARAHVDVEGLPVELPSEAAVPVGMAIHELTTNAAKHGALSAFGGRVEVRWHVETKDGRPMLHFSWVEKDGPRVAAPDRQGFGSRLLQRVLTTQLQADVKMDFPQDGLRFTMVMPIPGEPPPFNPDP